MLEDCKRFASYLADNNYHLSKTINNEVAIWKNHNGKTIRKSLDEVLVEYEKKLTNC